MEPYIPPHLATGDLGYSATRHLRLGEIRDTGFLRPHMCMETFMVLVTEETVHRCGRAEKKSWGWWGGGARKSRVKGVHLLRVGLGSFCGSHGPDAMKLSLTL